jgi:hypothetical protein
VLPGPQVVIKWSGTIGWSFLSPDLSDLFQQDDGSIQGELPRMSGVSERRGRCSPPQAVRRAFPAAPAARPGPLGCIWRRERDSNPRRAFDPYTLSRGAPSTTRPSLRVGSKTLYLQRLNARTRRIGPAMRAAMILKHPGKGKRVERSASSLPTGLRKPEALEVGTTDDARIAVACSLRGARFGIARDIRARADTRI